MRVLVLKITRQETDLVFPSSLLDTCRIRAGNTYSEIAEMAGTSATYIETHYKHYDDGMLRTAALKSFRVDGSGGIDFTD